MDGNTKQERTVVHLEKDGKHYSWDVDYVLRVYSFDDEDDIVNGD